ncbi:hypothetical protein FHL15_004812 [Xylaria flabelliformis]|uniref:Uncharacterized protein n=1 Tax=Xylaria flabelliformis TaxID=2512241 RepID=A0A553I2C0_9PEZI|nr:hypothetical protein FHL15_004812 [Xylaria flabelliformis]
MGMGMVMERECEWDWDWGRGWNYLARRKDRGRAAAVDRTWKMVVIPITQRARKVQQIASSAPCGVLLLAAAAAYTEPDAADGNEVAVEDEREVGAVAAAAAVALEDRGRGRVPIGSADSQQMVFGLPWITP